VQGSINARSSKPLVKEDEVDRDKRRESVEKQKSAKDLEKKRKRRRISSVKRWRHVGRSPGKGGSLRRTLPTRTTAMRATTAVTTPRGWRPVSTGSSRARRKPTSPSRGREPLRERRADAAMANRGSLLCAVLTPTPLRRLRKVGPSPTPNLLPRLRHKDLSSFGQEKALRPAGEKFLLSCT